MQFGIFSQGIDGLTWLANYATIEEAQAVLDEYSSEEPDFVMILPVYGFKDIDGSRQG